MGTDGRVPALIVQAPGAHAHLEFWLWKILENFPEKNRMPYRARLSSCHRRIASRWFFHQVALHAWSRWSLLFALALASFWFFRQVGLEERLRIASRNAALVFF
jgi:hypothetical protein